MLNGGDEYTTPSEIYKEIHRDNMRHDLCDDSEDDQYSGNGA